MNFNLDYVQIEEDNIKFFKDLGFNNYNKINRFSLENTNSELLLIFECNYEHINYFIYEDTEIELLNEGFFTDKDHAILYFSKNFTSSKDVRNYCRKLKIKELLK